MGWRRGGGDGGRVTKGKTTRVSNLAALKQIVSADGKRVLSLVQTGSGLFSFVEETESDVSPGESLDGYWYWEETICGGLYGQEDEAWNAARRAISWGEAG